MTRHLYDFECVKGHRHEALVDSETRTLPCPKCKRPAQRLIPAPRCMLEGISGDFPGAAMKWEKDRESHMKKERKNMERHGTHK